MKKLLTVADLVKEHNLEVLFTPCELTAINIQDKNIDRIGMQLMGYFPIHHSHRFHMMGLPEASYLATLEETARKEAIDNFFKAGTSGLIIANDAHCDPQILEAAKTYNKVVVKTEASPSEYIHDFYYFTAEHFAPQTTIHGGLVCVHGEGVLIIGDSGIGKSETAVQLAKRGHRIIADDSVEIKRMPDKYLLGAAPPLTQGFIELRGIGIVNVQTLYGTQAVQSEIKVTSAVNFVTWKQGEEYERLGFEQETMEILGIAIPLSKVPVRPGRDLAGIIEVHALNQRAKRYGYNATEELNTQFKKQVTEGK